MIFPRQAKIFVILPNVYVHHQEILAQQWLNPRLMESPVEYVTIAAPTGPKNKQDSLVLFCGLPNRRVDFPDRVCIGAVEVGIDNGRLPEWDFFPLRVRNCAHKKYCKHQGSRTIRHTRQSVHDHR